MQVAREALKHYLDDFSNEDAVLLGYTLSLYLNPYLPVYCPKELQ